MSLSDFTQYNSVYANIRKFWFVSKSIVKGIIPPPFFVVEIVAIRGEG